MWEVFVTPKRSECLEELPGFKIQQVACDSNIGNTPERSELTSECKVLSDIAKVTKYQ